MSFIRWILQNFGIAFGPVFLIYIFLIIRRVTILWDLLRKVPDVNSPPPIVIGENNILWFLDDLLKHLEKKTTAGAGSVDAIIDAVWAEVECRVTSHFTALNGYVNTLILVGFAGTIFGSIGAFNEMFQGLAEGGPVTGVFMDSWNNGLASALYTSLGAAVIGGVMVTLLCSRLLMSRAKRLETIVGLRISEIIDESKACQEDHEKA